MSRITYVVKRIRKKLMDGTIREYRYVYIYRYTDDGKVLSRCIGRLDEIVEIYLKAKNVAAPVGLEPTTTGLGGPRSSLLSYGALFRD